MCDDIEFSSRKKIKTEKSVFNNIKALLKCPVCYEYLDTKCKSCKNGHNICTSCFENIDDYHKTCPMCKSAFGNVNTLLINQLYETMNIKRTCEFDGCQQEMAMSSYDKHIKHCKYRPMNCRFYGCKYQFTNNLKEYMEHVANAHNYKEIVRERYGRTSKEPYLIKINTSMDDNRLIMNYEILDKLIMIYLEEDNFLIAIRATNLDNIIKFTYSIIPPNHIVEMPWYKISIGGANDILSASYRKDYTGTILIHHEQIFDICYKIYDNHYHFNLNIEKIK